MVGHLAPLNDGATVIDSSATRDNTARWSLGRAEVLWTAPYRGQLALSPKDTYVMLWGRPDVVVLDTKTGCLQYAIHGETQAIWIDDNTVGYIDKTHTLRLHQVAAH